jgi:nucleoside phosphorylase
LLKILKHIVVGPWLRVLFRPWVEGDEYVPDKGAAIFASNHLSFSDSFFFPLVVKRPITFLAKSDYFTGTVFTTNRRVWEHDDSVREYLLRIRAIGIDMETATIFLVGFANGISKGALLLVSDNPMTPEGVKSAESDRTVTAKFVSQHLEIGLDALRDLRDSGQSVKHLRFE